MILALFKACENELKWVQNNFRLFLVYFLASRKLLFMFAPLNVWYLLYFYLKLTVICRYAVERVPNCGPR